MSARPSLPTKAAALFGFSDILHIETFSTNESNINFWHVGIRHTDSLPKTGPDTLNPRPPLDAPVSRLPGDLRCWVAGLSRTRRCARLDRDGGSCSGRRTQWQEWSARIGRVVPTVGIWSPCRIRGCERRRAPAPRSGYALDCRRQSGAEERGVAESDGALRDAMARGARELRCSCRPVWPVDRPCARPKATPWHRARHGFKREPDPRRAGDERLERPLRLHLLSPAVRVQPVWRPRTLCSACGQRAQR